MKSVLPRGICQFCGAGRGSLFFRGAGRPSLVKTCNTLGGQEGGIEHEGSNQQWIFFSEEGYSYWSGWVWRKNIAWYIFRFAIVLSPDRSTISRVAQKQYFYQHFVLFPPHPSCIYALACMGNGQFYQNFPELWYQCIIICWWVLDSLRNIF